MISPFCTVKGMTRLKGRSTGSIPSRALSVSSVACSRAGGEWLQSARWEHWDIVQKGWGAEGG